jgi:hypothetical protein
MNFSNGKANAAACSAKSSWTRGRFRMIEHEARACLSNTLTLLATADEVIE